MRGLFTAGVLDALFEGGVRFDGIIGVSAGACFGCNYKSHQPGRVIRYNTRFAKDPRYCSWRTLYRTGDLFGAEFCYHDLPDELDPFDAKTFASDPTAFYCVTTDCFSGKPVYHHIAKIDYGELEWMRASASMPLVSRPIELDGLIHLDGGLSDGIPVRYFEKLGYDRNVVILTRPRAYRKKPSWKHALLKPFLLNLPIVYRAIRTRHVRYNATLEYLAKRETEGAALVIAPEADLPIGRICHDPETMRSVYELGLAAGRARLGDVGTFMRR